MDRETHANGVTLAKLQVYLSTKEALRVDHSLEQTEKNQVLVLMSYRSKRSFKK